MIDKIVDSKDLIEIIIMFVTASCTIIGVWWGVKQINLTLKEQRFSNRLELADNLMNEYISLSGEASKAAFYLVAEQMDKVRNIKIILVVWKNMQSY